MQVLPLGNCIVHVTTFDGGGSGQGKRFGLVGVGLQGQAHLLRGRTSEGAALGGGECVGVIGAQAGDIGGKGHRLGVSGDGVRTPVPANLDLLPSPKEIVGVEFYDAMGTVPPEYSRYGVGCGVLLIWTRRG